jgi:hypothetical protein
MAIIHPSDRPLLQYTIGKRRISSRKPYLISDYRKILCKLEAV